MSAYIVDKKCIEKIVTFIKNGNLDYFGMFQNTLALYNLKKSDDLQLLCKNLHSLNVNSVNFIYNEKSKELYENFNLNSSVIFFEFYYCLSEFLYQCSVDEKFTNSYIFLSLSKIRNYNARMYLEQSLEYEIFQEKKLKKIS